MWRGGAAWPEGRVSLGVAQLGDAGHALGMALRGGLETSATFDAAQVVLEVQLHEAGLAGTATVRTASLSATLHDPMGTRTLDAKLAAAGLAACGLTTGFDLSAAGPPDRVELRLNATADGAGAPIQITASGMLNGLARRLDHATPGRVARRDAGAGRAGADRCRRWPGGGPIAVPASRCGIELGDARRLSI